MEFAKEYEIPRAVMYDENTDLNNPMFDLNRQLINEKKNITILTQKNLDILINQTMKKIVVLDFQFSDWIQRVELSRRTENTAHNN